MKTEANATSKPALKETQKDISQMEGKFSYMEGQNCRKKMQQGKQ